MTTKRSRRTGKDYDLVESARVQADALNLARGTRRPGEPCLCGCGGIPAGDDSDFLPGHDSKLRAKKRLEWLATLPFLLLLLLVVRPASAANPYHIIRTWDHCVLRNIEVEKAIAAKNTRLELVNSTVVAVQDVDTAMLYEATYIAGVRERENIKHIQMLRALVVGDNVNCRSSGGKLYLFLNNRDVLPLDITRREREKL